MSKPKTSLPDEVVKHFNSSNKASVCLTVLNRLWEDLKIKAYPDQQGPYPAEHGEKHVTHVLLNLADLLRSFRMEPWEMFEVFAAGMIHDIAMRGMMPTGAYSDKAESIRRSHARYGLIKDLASKHLNSLPIPHDVVVSDLAERIVLIASGHASDDNQSIAEKEEVVKQDKYEVSEQLIRGMRVLRLADYLDLGAGRLAPTWVDHLWTGNQLRHVKLHNVLEILRLSTTKCIVVKAKQPKGVKFLVGQSDDAGPQLVEVSPIETLALLRSIHEDLKPIVDDFNKINGITRLWELKPLDERLFGQVWPLSSGVGLFKKVLEEELREWNFEKKGPMPVDLMGHSLSGRFVGDREELNDMLKKYLKEGKLKMRILLLDPQIENQQMCEVFDAQKEFEKNKRSIFPKYDKDGLVSENRGDILETLDKIKTEWVPLVQKGSSLEVMGTRRLMYLSLSRYGNCVVATPYTSRGLFNTSIGVVHGENSETSKAYTEEFDSIWKSIWETRLLIHKGTKDSEENPVLRLIPKSISPRWMDALDYERYFLHTKHADRIINIFDYVRSGSCSIPPPAEVEIQPSTICNLRCRHCVGQHLFGGSTVNEANPGTLAMEPFNELLGWEVDGSSVNRYRISGLLGDPLVDEAATNFTLAFLDKAAECGKETVLFTNGLGLESIIDNGDINRLLKATNIHVSLDAATSETFSQQKGLDAFDKIIKSLDILCTESRKSAGSRCRVGIGFVVNESNASEATKAIELAKEHRADFIRFKPDIRGTRAIPWGTWCETVDKITEKQKEEKNSIDVIMTNVSWNLSRIPSLDVCWSQYLFASVAPDGRVHVCDHLTGSNHDNNLGTLATQSFPNIWEDAVREKKLGKKRTDCQICPPFNWHINRLLDQLFVLYEFDESKLREWITRAQDT